MKLIVPVKHVLDYNLRPRIKADGGDVDLSGMRMSMNPFCEVALEEAVRLRENSVAKELLAVSIGGDDAKETLRTALAMGADRALLIRHEGGAESLAIAGVLAALAGSEKPDLIILGKQAIDDDCASVGQMLAAMLDWPQGSFVSKLDISEGIAEIMREIEGGTQQLRLRLPAVVTVDLCLNEPRYVSLPAIMRARQKTIETKNATEYGVDMRRRLEVVGVEAPPPRRGAEILADADELLDRLEKRGAL